MNLSDHLNLLQKIGRDPNKGLSQNFLIDNNSAEKIVRTAGIIPGDPVLEIGPGCGMLTTHLLRAGAHVIAIEKDAVLSQELGRLQTQDKRLHSIQKDFLLFDLKSLLSTSPLKVVANLPYHITTPLFEILLRHGSLFSSFTLMVQKEFADRINLKSNSYLALLFQFHAHPPTSFKVSASCFYPKPQIDSVVLHFDSRPPPLPDSTPLFTLIRHAFQQKRKMIASTLRTYFSHDKIMASLDQAGISHTARPESLSLDQWLSFYAHLQNTLHCVL
ncbi:MAG: ribosomal RNA small subunit methyltransferase A [Chlamydiia bacterium]|nr:ribosomal RNA small subunit methyltransferase A [Chlamydiia bacterium]